MRSLTIMDVRLPLSGVSQVSFTNDQLVIESIGLHRVFGAARSANYEDPVVVGPEGGVLAFAVRAAVAADTSVGVISCPAKSIMQASVQ